MSDRLAVIRATTDRRLAGKCRHCRRPIGDAETVLDGINPHLHTCHKVCYAWSVRVCHRPRGVAAPTLAALHAQLDALGVPR